MVAIYYHDRAQQIGWHSAQIWLRCWPPALCRRIERLRDESDRVRSALGWRLLELYAQRAGLGGLDHIGLRVSPGAKPCCTVLGDFSITHSASLVACAVAQHARVGLDAERRRPVDASGWHRYVSAGERSLVARYPERLLPIWTCKEAVAKAHGGGLADVASVCLDGNRAVLHGRTWFLTPVALHPDYVVHLASDTRSAIVAIHRISGLDNGSPLARAVEPSR